MVTGGATGLGRAVALEFAQGGCGVAFNYVELPGRDVGAQALLTETAIKALGVPCYSAVCDVRKMTSVEQFVAEVRSKINADLDEVGSVSVRLAAEDGTLQACAGVR